MTVQGVNSLLYHIHRHGGIDLTSQLYKSGILFKFTGLPGQVKGGDRDAVSPQAGSRSKFHKAEGLGCCCIEHLMDIDIPLMENHSKCIDECDLDRPQDVCSELDR